MHFQPDRRKHPKQQTPRHLIDTPQLASRIPIQSSCSRSVCWALCYCHWDADVPAPRHAASHPTTLYTIYDTSPQRGPPYLQSQGGTQGQGETPPGRVGSLYIGHLPPNEGPRVSIVKAEHRARVKHHLVWVAS